MNYNLFKVYYFHKLENWGTELLLFCMVRWTDSMLLSHKVISLFLYFSFNSLVIESYFTQIYAQVNLLYSIFLINKVPKQSHTILTQLDKILFSKTIIKKKE